MFWFSVLAVLLSALVYYRFSENLFPSPNSSVLHGEKSIFDFTVDRVDDGEPIQLSNYRGKKAYLVVNVASQCGLTDRNYAELQQIYEKYR